VGVDDLDDGADPDTESQEIPEGKPLETSISQ
jgi:hypothetical protein